MAKGDMTVRQRKYVAGVVSGKSKRQAALAAGYNEGSANAVATNIEKPIVRAAIERALQKANITDERIAAKINEGLEAKRVSLVGEAGVETPDYAVQHKFLETAIKLKGLLPTTPETAIQVNNFTVVRGEE